MSHNINVLALLPKESAAKARGWAMYDELVQPLSYPQVISWAREEEAWLSKGTAEHYVMFGSDIFPVIWIDVICCST